MPRGTDSPLAQLWRQDMNATYEKCGHPGCGQWINLNINHYAVVQTADGKKHYLHHNPCMYRFIEDNPLAFIAEEHVNHKR